MVKMGQEGIESVELTLEAESRWTEDLSCIYSNSLTSGMRSWYDGSNVPGNRVEPLVLIGEFPSYRNISYSALGDNFRGFKGHH